jgi:ribose transport system permease protein
VIIILGVFTTIRNPNFISVNNIKNILSANAVLGLVAAGVTILIISGNFDISIGSIIGFAGTMMAVLLMKGVPDAVAILICIAIATACSALNGALSNALKAPAFIITLATAGLYQGICLSIMKGGNQMIMGKLEYLISRESELFGVIPLLFLISLLGYIIVGSLLRYTQFGRRVYAVGSNPRAAFLAGIRVNLNKIWFFVLSGITTGVAKVLLISRLGASQSTNGAGTELMAIGAVIIGGVPINGGKGNMLGTFFGVMLMGIIFNMLNILRVNPYLQQVANAALILFSIGITSLRLRLLK